MRDRERRGVAAPASVGKTAARAGGTAPSADPDERIRQLEARVAELEASEHKLATERDILRRAMMHCHACPRLVEWREETVRVKCSAFSYWEYCGRPVPGFGPPDAAMMICRRIRRVP
ncbi:hypothetical protein ABT132_45165 [Streptomyces mirabilis]